MFSFICTTSLGLVLVLPRGHVDQEGGAIRCCGYCFVLNFYVHFLWVLVCCLCQGHIKSCSCGLWRKWDQFL